MKKNHLVTLTDQNYIIPAKQLFSSVYWNAEWKGDYMLLAHEIPEKKLKWFRNKGILIRKYKPFYPKKFLSASQIWTEEMIDNGRADLHKKKVRYFYRYLFWKFLLIIKENMDKNFDIIRMFLKNNHSRLYFKLKRLKDKVYKTSQ